MSTGIPKHSYPIKSFDTDTIIEINKAEDSLINQLINNNAPVQSEEIVKLGEFTKYGFKNSVSQSNCKKKSQSTF